MRLDNFSDYIKENAYNRGLEYYLDGNVIELNEIEPNNFKALVSGTKDYDVLVKINEDDQIISSSCSCPVKGTCKHEVAVYLSILDFLNNRVINKFIADNLSNTLKRLTKEDLVDVLIGLAKTNPKIATQLIIKVSPKEARTYLGVLNWLFLHNTSHDFKVEITEFMLKQQRHLSDVEAIKFIIEYLFILIKSVKRDFYDEKLSYDDDFLEDYYFEYDELNYYRTHKYLKVLSEKINTLKEPKDLNLFIEKLFKNYVIDFDVELTKTIFDEIINLARFEKIRNVVLSYLSKQSTQTFVLYHFKILKKHEAAKALEFAKTNIDVDEIKEYLLTNLLENKAYFEIINLLENTNLNLRFSEFLARAYYETNNPKAKDLLLKLCLSGKHKKYYVKLKKSFNVNLNEIIEQSKASPKFLAYLYESEVMYEQLLELVVENETCLLKEYFHKFPKIYFKRLKLEVIEIFISKITKKPHLGYYWQNQYYLDIINYLSADFKGDIQKIISRVNNKPALVMLLNKKLKESGL